MGEQPVRAKPGLAPGTPGLGLRDLDHVVPLLQPTDLQPHLAVPSRPLPGPRVSVRALSRPVRLTGL